MLLFNLYNPCENLAYRDKLNNIFSFLHYTEVFVLRDFPSPWFSQDSSLPPSTAAVPGQLGTCCQPSGNSAAKKENSSELLTWEWLPTSRVSGPPQLHKEKWRTEDRAGQMTSAEPDHLCLPAWPLGSLSRSFLGTSA